MGRGGDPVCAIFNRLELKFAPILYELTKTKFVVGMRVLKSK